MYDDALLTGEFNSYIQVKTLLMDNVLSLGLTHTYTVNLTHHTSTNRTLPGIFFVADVSYILLYDQVSAPCFSWQDLIFMTYHFNIPSTQMSFRYHDFKNIAYSVLEENISLTNWARMYYMTSIDEQVSFLESSVQRLYDLAVPICSRTILPRIKPWFSTYL